MSSKGLSKGRKAVRPSNPPAAQVSDLSRHLLRAQEEERKRISRELHDETGQGLMVLRLYLGMLTSDSLDKEFVIKIQEAMKMLDRTIADLRRVISRLSPRALEELGLLAAIRKEARELSKNTGIKGSLDLPSTLGSVDHEIEIAIYRLVQETLHNIAKHSQAQNFIIRLEDTDHALCLLVDDDGVGFSSKASSRSQAFGVRGMRERVAALGGTVRIRSRKGRGTRIRVMFPGTHLARRHREEVAAGSQQQARGEAKKRNRAESRFHGPVKPSIHLTHAHQVHSS